MNEKRKIEVVLANEVDYTNLQISLIDCYHMWRWLSNNPTKGKDDWLRSLTCFDGDVGKLEGMICYAHFCFSCAYIMHMYNSDYRNRGYSLGMSTVDNCINCPTLSIWNCSNMSVYQCTNPHSPYDKWEMAIAYRSANWIIDRRNNAAKIAAGVRKLLKNDHNIDATKTPIIVGWVEDYR